LRAARGSLGKASPLVALVKAVRLHRSDIGMKPRLAKTELLRFLNGPKAPDS
jgi:hypothetical protein